MAYTPNNLAMVINPVGGDMPRVFLYLNATPDSNATVIGASYFSDGIAKGMRVGDIVDAVNVGTAKHTRYQVLSVTSTAATVQVAVAV